MFSKTSVYGCSLFIVALFVLSCYLMSFVNPPPLVKPKYMHRMSDYYGGLESASPIFVTHPPLPYIFKNVTNGIVIRNEDPDLQAVYPPIYSQSNPTYKPLNYPEARMETVQNNNYLSDPNTISLSIPPIKGQRRSINAIEKQIDTRTGSLILKILDDHGKSRIEIKINQNNDTILKKSSRMHRSSFKQDLNVVYDEKGKDNVDPGITIKILPNVTVVISGLRKIVNKSAYNITVNNTKDSRNQTTTLPNVNGENTATVSSDEKHNASLTVIPVTAIKTTVRVFNSQTKGIANKTDILDTTFIKSTLKALQNSKFALKVHFDNVTRSFTEAYDAVA